MTDGRPLEPRPETGIPQLSAIRRPAANEDGSVDLARLRRAVRAAAALLDAIEDGALLEAAPASPAAAARHDNALVLLGIARTQLASALAELEPMS